MDASLADRLCDIPIFAGLDRPHLEAVAGLVEDFEAEAGIVLVQPGMIGSGLFLIEEGQVSLTLRDREIEIGPGDILGELALLDDRGTHTMRARTKTAVRGYCITRDGFAELLDREPKVALPILRTVAHRLVDQLTHH